jgi:hypothetical protein
MHCILFFSRIVSCLCLIAVPVLAFAKQTCNTSTMALSVPDSAFSDNGDGTVTDQRSRMTWMQCMVGQVWKGGQCTGQPQRLTWQAAQEFAAVVNKQGDYFFNDWRVPSLRDLAMITERQCQNPRTNLALFPGTPADFFWTSSAVRSAFEGDRFYALDFGSQGVQLRQQHETHFVRLMRYSD